MRKFYSKIEYILNILLLFVFMQFMYKLSYYMDLNVFMFFYVSVFVFGLDFITRKEVKKLDFKRKNLYMFFSIHLPLLMAFGLIVFVVNSLGLVEPTNQREFVGLLKVYFEENPFVHNVFNTFIYIFLLSAFVSFVLQIILMTKIIKNNNV